MIYGLDHERIVRFYGITLQPVGFVMEWAGLGSLDDVIKGYHSHGVHVCPDAVFAITKQVRTSCFNVMRLPSAIQFLVKYKFKPKACLASLWSCEYLNKLCKHKVKLLVCPVFIHQRYFKLPTPVCFIRVNWCSGYTVATYIIVI